MKHAAERAQMDIDRQRAEHDEQLRHDKEKVEAELHQLRERNEAEKVRNAAIAALGVDMTTYLCALATERPDQHIRLETDATPKLHLALPHQSATKRHVKKAWQLSEEDKS